MPRIFGLSVALAGVVASGCTGQVGEGAAGGSAPPPATGPSRPGPSLGNPPAPPPGTSAPMEAPGAAVFRRLTRVEYNNTIRDLLGDSSAPANTFPGDTQSSRLGFRQGAASWRSVDAGPHLRGHREAGGRRRRQAAAPSLIPCKTVPAADADQDRCAQDFIAQFGLRAFRRPLAADETTALFDLYTAQRTRAKHDFPNAIRVVLAGMLLSPNFLYRWEIVPQGGRQGGHPGALQLLRDGLAAVVPDLGLDARRRAVRRRRRKQAGDARPDRGRGPAHAEGPQAVDTLADFFIQWLGVTELPERQEEPEVYPTFTPELVEAMLAETRGVRRRPLMKGDGKLETLFTSPRSFIDAGLAKRLQGGRRHRDHPAAGALNAEQRAGILTQGTFLATHAKADESNPISRGKILADRVLCRDLPLPPDDVPDPSRRPRGSPRASASRSTARTPAPSPATA